jgi:ketosteroid isomerase-like protein
MNDRPTEHLAEHLSELYSAWFAAITSEGVGPLEYVLAEEWRYTNYDGMVRGKAAYLDHVASVAEDVTFVGPYAVEASLHGDVALVLGGYRVEGLPGGGVLELRFTGAWVRRDGRWQCLAHHNSEVTG